MASLSPVKATSQTKEAHAAVRKQLVGMFNPKADLATVAGRAGRTKAIDSKISALAAAMAKDSASRTGRQGLGDKDVVTVPTSTTVVVQPKASTRKDATVNTPLIVKDEDEKKLTCCQKVMKAVCCCISS
ncbi:MAG: hypothetical protein S4CHLAM6_11030 [Chlamydiae bacterium]|nr:hypothetical protein [Chlamydiota bacterium]